MPGRLRVVEGEPVADGEHATRRADVVQVDALQVVGGVVAPLPDALGVESGVAARFPSASTVSRASNGRSVSSSPSDQRSDEQLRQLDAGGVEQVGVEVQRDPGVGQLRHSPQHPSRVNWLTTDGSHAAEALGPNVSAMSINRPPSA